MRGESGNNSRIVSRLKHLQAGTGTVQIAAINTAAITAVIFSLVDRLMASSERDANLSAALYGGLSCLRCDGDHAPTGYLACLSSRSLVGFGRRRGLQLRGWHRRRLEPRPRRAQGIKARRVGISVAVDDATDCRCHRGELVGGEVHCRHGSGLLLSPAPSHKAGRHRQVKRALS
jgi:hypothetical protein